MQAAVPGCQWEAGHDPAEGCEGAGVADLLRLLEGQAGGGTLQDTQHL